MESAELATECEQLFHLSNAYLCTCEHLCDEMISGDFESDAPTNKVVLNLCHQGIELFLKAALLKAGKPPEHGHNLMQLQKKYASAYPSKTFDLPVPFGYLSPVNEDLFVDSNEKRFGMLHQKFRYSSDIKGIPWPQVENLNPNEFLNELITVKKRAYQIWFSLGKQNAQQNPNK